MAPKEIEQAIHDIMPEVRYMLEEHGMQHSCIDAASLLTKVLHTVGISNAYRLTVNVQAVNEAFRRYVDTYGPPADEAAHQACFDAGGAIAVVGRDATDIPKGNWAGHLTVIVPGAFGDKHALLDPSITQADWPEFGIVLQPLCLRADQDFVSGMRSARYEIGNVLLIYDAYPDDHSYNDGCDCMVKDGIDTAVALVLKRLERRRKI